MHAFCPRGKASLLIGVAVQLCSTFEVVSGGAWAPGGFWPPWADHRWKVPVLESPMVAGPMWLVVAPPAANRLLAGSDRARRMAVGEHRLPDGGAVWQLCPEVDGPLGEGLETWMAVLITLGVWSAPPRLAD